jgi:hypothetical protein
MKKMTTTAALIAAALPLAAAGLAPATAAEAPAAGAAKYVVTATINKGTAIGGQDIVKIRGRVTPRAVGQRVILQQRLEGKRRWAVSGTARVKPTGKFVLKDDPEVAGARFYRVVKPAAGAVKAGVSQEMLLVVYAWEALASRSSGPNAGVTTGTVPIGTDSYAGSIYKYSASSPGFIEYTLGKECLQLTATYALTDDSATGGTGSVLLSADGVQRTFAPLAIGTITTKTIDVRDAFRIRFDFASSSSPVAYPAAAGVQVLCTK